MSASISNGAANGQTQNPFAVLLAKMPTALEVEAAYEKERIARTAEYTPILLSPDFKKLEADTYLRSLLESPTYVDPRNSLVVWAHPPSSIKDMVSIIQERVRPVAPGLLWTMPPENLHITVLEIAHSLTPEKLATVLSQLSPDIIEKVTDYASVHHPRLIKPMINYDDGALVLKFLPSAEDEYTYLHLRRDLFDIVQEAGVTLASRYASPSAHLTIGRFVVKDEDVVQPGAMAQYVAELEAINRWLQAEYWPVAGEDLSKHAGQWQIGEGKGLHLVGGRVWYGTGNTVRMGRAASI